VSKTSGGTTGADAAAGTTGIGAEMPHQALSLKTEILQKAILNSVHFSIITTDAKGVIRSFNIGAERMLGYAASDVVNKKTADELHDPQQLIARAARLSAEFGTEVVSGFDALTFKALRGIEDTYELDYIRKDGSRFPADVTITALRDDQGEIIGYLKTGIDKSAQVALNAALKEKDRLKDEFVATVSHELRTPLTSIAGSLGLLTGNAAGKLSDSAVRLITIAYANSQRLVRLLNDILDIEKMESGKAIYNFKRVEVRPLVEQIIEENGAFAESSDVRIRLDSASATGNVRADPDRLAQIVTNLLSNAIKFSPPGEEVVVAVETQSDTVRISVRDHGHGIPDEFKPRIFEKFTQADVSDTRHNGGTGLGLSIVKQIVTRLGGAVGFEDAPGGGTVFHVDLPDWAQAVRTQSQLIGILDFRVLLCEDNPDAAIVLCERLRQEGFLTDIALTAGEAVARVAAESYSAILVDLQRPESDGIGLVKRLRAQPQVYNTLLVVLSADLKQAHEEDKPSTLLNILDWLDAPIDIARLVRVLDRPIVRNQNARPRVLHVASNPDVLHAVAKALDAKTEIMSVNSIDKARRALATNRFDVAVLDVALAAGSGFELLHELRDSEGDAIPLVVFSPQEANPEFAVQIQEALIKSRTPVEKLVATLRKRLARRSSPPNDKDNA
jgi:PAS domain S-box-containing protein